MEQDIRWKQRFNNFQKTFGLFEKIMAKPDLSELEEQGLIKSFEYTYELAWTTMQDFLKYRGQTDIYGSRDVFRKAFHLGLLDHGEFWMDMLKSRNATSHTYNEETARVICRAVKENYYPAFTALIQNLQQLKDESIS